MVPFNNFCRMEHLSSYMSRKEQNRVYVREGDTSTPMKQNNYCQAVLTEANQIKEVLSGPPNETLHGKLISAGTLCSYCIQSTIGTWISTFGLKPSRLVSHGPTIGVIRPLNKIQGISFYCLSPRKMAHSVERFIQGVRKYHEAGEGLRNESGWGIGSPPEKRTCVRKLVEDSNHHCRLSVFGQDPWHPQGLRRAALISTKTFKSTISLPISLTSQSMMNSFLTLCWVRRSPSTSRRMSMIEKTLLI